MRCLDDLRWSNEGSILPPRLHSPCMSSAGLPMSTFDDGRREVAACMRVVHGATGSNIGGPATCTTRAGHSGHLALPWTGAWRALLSESKYPYIYRSGALGGAGGGGGVEGSADSWTLPQTVTEMKRERRTYIWSYEQEYGNANGGAISTAREGGGRTLPTPYVFHRLDGSWNLNPLDAQGRAVSWVLMSRCSLTLGIYQSTNLWEKENVNGIWVSSLSLWYSRGWVDPRRFAGGNLNLKFWTTTQKCI